MVVKPETMVSLVMLEFIDRLLGPTQPSPAQPSLAYPSLAYPNLASNSGIPMEGSLLLEWTESSGSSHCGCVESLKIPRTNKNDVRTT